MGALEEGGKAISGFMDAMKSQPLALALVVMNCVLLFVLWKVVSNADEAREKQMHLIFDAQNQMQILLSKCVVPN